MKIYMRQLIKRFLWVVLLATGVQASWGFALLGPIANGGDSWQTAAIGYDEPYIDESGILTTGSGQVVLLPGGPVFLQDIGGPKNIGEGYRRNAGTIYYAYDANFLGFFGSNGAVSVDGAFDIMNSLTNVDSYTNDLSNFPLGSQQFNYTAQSLFLTDIKSATLHLLVEQMGLADPERFSWTLAERYLPPGGTCPNSMLYLVVQRNFNFISTPLNELQYSSYVNDVLYSYLIDEFCPPANPLAYTIPFSVDPLAQEFTSVAANNGEEFGGVQFSFGGGLQVGGFYTGLTRDDVAGLRYLLTSNNVARETAAAGSLLMTTNIGTPAQEQLLTTADLSALLAAASTNTLAALQALFPNVTVASSTFNFSAVCTPNVIAYFTNYNAAPYGSAQISVVVTNGTICVPQTNFFDVFANVITNGNLAGNPNIINPGGYALNYSPSTAATMVTTTLGPPIGSPYGSPVVTNSTVQSVTQAGVPSGEYFLIPTNQCGWEIVPTSGFPIANQPVYTTNIIASATNNATTSSNGVVTTNATTGFVTTQSIVTAFTSHTYVVEPIFCPLTPTPTNLYQGVQNVKFARANFDSLIGQTFQPITNYYTMVMVTNSQTVTQTFQRVVTQPDILLSASDFIGGNTFNGSASRNINFDQNNVLPGLAGPGVINSPATFNYNKIGDAFRNGSPADFPTATFLSELNQQPTLAWASFDSSTNEPVVYPNGTSIQNLENQILIQISPASLPNGTSGVSYPATTFTASGGSFQPPFTWSWTPTVGETLPPGLTLSSGGTLSGTPTQSGTFDIVIQLTDSLSRTVQWDYSITIE